MEAAFPVLCAWCGATKGHSSTPNSYGICKACAHRLTGIPQLSEQELEALPFGLIELDPCGIVLSYNNAEESLSGLKAAEVIGKDFFRDIAPCTAVQEFQGRFVAFLADPSEIKGFKFTFRFPGRETKVKIALVPSGEGTAFVIVNTEPAGAVL